MSKLVELYIRNERRARMRKNCRFCVVYGMNKNLLNSESDFYSVTQETRVD